MDCNLNLMTVTTAVSRLYRPTCVAPTAAVLIKLEAHALSTGKSEQSERQKTQSQIDDKDKRA